MPGRTAALAAMEKNKNRLAARVRHQLTVSEAEFLFPALLILGMNSRVRYIKTLFTFILLFSNTLYLLVPKRLNTPGQPPIYGTQDSDIGSSC